MPPLTRWFVKLSLLYFFAALAGGVWQAAGGPAWLTPVTTHLLVVGWITGMIFGVAYWMFPRHTRERPRGENRLAVATFALFQAGLVLRVAGEASATGIAMVVAAVLQWLAAVGFIFLVWPRVKER